MCLHTRFPIVIINIKSKNKTLICSICQFQWCKYAHYSYQWDVTEDRVVKRCVQWALESQYTCIFHWWWSTSPFTGCNISFVSWDVTVDKLCQPLIKWWYFLCSNFKKKAHQQKAEKLAWEISECYYYPEMKINTI